MDRNTINRRTALAAAVALALAACAAPDAGTGAAAVPTYRGNASRTGENGGPGPGRQPRDQVAVRRGRAICQLARRR